MDVTQYNLRTLLHDTDRAFNMVIQHPSSAAHVAQYELAKTALNEHLCVMRHSVQKKLSADNVVVLYLSHVNLPVLAPENYRLSGCFVCQQYREE